MGSAMNVLAQYPTIPDSVKFIDEFAFSGCTSLTSVTLPSSVRSIGEYAFYGCDSLANKNGLIIYGNVLYGCINEGPVITIPDGIEIISDRALFIQKRNKNVFTEYDLKEVILPDSVKDIHLNAFINSNDADPDFGTGESLSSMISRKMPKKMNIPKGYLKQSKGSFDATMALYLLEGPWKALGTKEDYGCLILNQHSKKLTEFCYKELKDKDIFDFLLEIQCKYNYKTGLCAIAEWACNNKKLISGTQIESLKNMICLAKDKKAQKIIDKV